MKNVQNPCNSVMNSNFSLQYLQVLKYVLSPFSDINCLNSFHGFTSEEIGGGSMDWTS
jgi:hypothetical protein